MQAASSLLSLALIFSLSGCSPTLDNHGFDPDEIPFTKVNVGSSTRQEVQNILGSPTSISNFPPETWYYISKKTSQTAFLPAKTIDQAVVSVTFNTQGIVTDLKHINKEAGLEIKPVTRETPTTGQSDSVLREIFSNFGRLAPKSTPRT